MKNWLTFALLGFVFGCGGSTGGGGTPAGDGGGAGGSGGTGGSSGSGSGGTGGTIPVAKEANKVDLLLMIDNSISMADKQVVMVEALPNLLKAFTTPPVGSDGQPIFAPVNDIHFGVITSSIGSHGGDICSESSAGFNPTQNDHAHLLGAVRTGLVSHQSQGFLWWDPLGANGGESDSATLIANFQSHIQAAGEQGCGYEASLESWYRFLIDPEPPLTVSSNGGITTLEGIDDTLLQQRKNFLRPDSLVIIVMLTDENDCSIADTGQNWIFAQASGGGGPFHLPYGTTACESDPNSPCCRSCASTASPAPGCAETFNDNNCQLGSMDDLSDHLNLRCWDQKRRFGIDALYPTRRYVDGLTKPLVPNRNGDLVANPLFTDLTGGSQVRALNNVLFVPIVGVPWQDIATPDSLSGTGLTYMSSAEIAAQGRWDWLIPRCKTPGPDGVCDVWDLADQPDDPFMIESVSPRSGVNPATNTSVAPPSAPPSASPINGHDYNIPLNNDLQYACIFELSEPRDCTTVPPGTGCDCDNDSDPSGAQSPLCQQTDGSYGTLQRFAKAYPGTRQLQVAKDLGTNAVLGSACPKTLGPANPAHAYIPVVNAIARELSGRLVK
jgi:hypothetical protein